MQTSIGKYQCIPVAFVSQVPLTGRVLNFTPTVFDADTGEKECAGSGEFSMTYPATPGIYDFSDDASLWVTSASEFSLVYCYITGGDSLTGITTGTKYFKYTACVQTSEGLQEFHFEEACQVNTWCQQSADFSAELLVDGQVVSQFTEGQDVTVRFRTSGSNIISNTTGFGLIESNIVQYVEAQGSTISTFDNILNDSISQVQGFQSTSPAEFEALVTFTGLTANANYRAYAVFKEGEIYHSCFFDFTGSEDVPTIDDSCEITYNGQTFSGCCIMNIATGSQISVCNTVDPSTYTGDGWNPTVLAGISTSESGSISSDLISSSNINSACADVNIDWVGCRYLIFKWQNDGFEIIRPVRICAVSIVEGSLPIDSLVDQDGNDVEGIYCSEDVTTITACYLGTDGDTITATLEPSGAIISVDSVFVGGEACVVIDATSLEIGQEYCINAQSISPEEGENPTACIGVLFHYTVPYTGIGTKRNGSFHFSQYSSDISDVTANTPIDIGINGSSFSWAHFQNVNDISPPNPIVFTVNFENGQQAEVSINLSGEGDCVGTNGGLFCTGTKDICIEEEEDPETCEQVASIDWDCDEGIVTAMVGESVPMSMTDELEYNEDCSTTYTTWIGSLEAEMICLRRTITFANECDDLVVNEVITCPPLPPDILCENTAEIEEITTNTAVTLNLTTDYSHVPTETFQVSMDGGVLFSNIVSGQAINIVGFDNLIYSYEATYEGCETVLIEGIIEFGDVVPCDYEGFEIGCDEVSEGVFEITKEGDESLLVLNELTYTTDGSDPQLGTQYSTNVTADMIAAVWTIQKEGCEVKKKFAYCCKTACEPEINITVEAPEVTVNVDACCDETPCEPTFNSGSGAEISICE